MDSYIFIEAVKNAGVVGEGGAGFPAHVKYNAQVDTVIANGCECEPLIHTDRHLMCNHADEIVRAMTLLVKSTGAQRGIIALKAKQKRAISILEKAIEGTDLTLSTLDNFYPAGDEQVLVKEVTGRTVPPLGIPLNVGVVVANTGSLVSVARAVEGRPVTHKYVTVTGDVATPSIISTPVGTSVQDCLDACGGPSISDPVYILGGPMMGPVVDTDEGLKRAVITKTSGAVIVVPRGHYLHQNARQPSNIMRQRAAAACIQCRYCTDLCPRFLIGHPFETHRVMRAFATGTELESEAAKVAMLCCECGVCETYACPMNLSPRRINIFVKNQYRNAGIQFDGSREIHEENVLLREFRRVPVPKLAARVGISRYMEIEPQDLGTLTPSSVSIPLRQHIGAPAQPVVNVGDTVSVGDVIGEIPADALGARVHASIQGVVAEVTDSVTIKGA